MSVKAIKMDDANEEFLERLLLNLHARTDRKFRVGTVEHGGHIWDLTTEELLEEAMSEAIDQFVYLWTLREKIKGSADTP